ncbi:hypothetical protein [Effusibacillus lacus]|uniref:hypothetical protein n=1 Tax=Effusibacillus lacus TaxID=1348429 RepID=UPI000BB74BBC|nr:hypothetical protein [Effusibacillus lacus]
MKIRFEIKPVQGGFKQQIAETAKQTGQELLAAPVDFTLAVVGNGNSMGINHFGNHFVARSIPLNTSDFNSEEAVPRFLKTANSIRFPASSPSAAAKHMPGFSATQTRFTPLCKTRRLSAT